MNGPAWRYKIPDHLIGIFSINFLEFTAASLTIQLAIHHKNDKSYPHRILAFTDSGSALGWLFKSNFDTDSHGCHDKIARDLAWFCIKNNTSLFAQHIKGSLNEIADSLSRDFHISDKNLTKIIISHLPPQVRKNFKIVQHPRKITSWLDSLRCGSYTNPVCVAKPTRSKLHILKNGKATSRSLESEMYGFDPSTRPTKISSSQVSPKKSEITNMEKSKLKRSSWPTQWQPPSVLYLRHSEKMGIETQPYIMTSNDQSFYNVN